MISMTEPPPPAPARSAAFVFVFITVLLDMLALGMIIPVLPKLVVDFLAGDAAGAADALRYARLRLRGGLRVRAGTRWTRGQCQPAAAVLDRRRAEPPQRPLWLPDPARIAAEGAPRAVRVAPRQSPGLARAVARALA